MSSNTLRRALSASSANSEASNKAERGGASTGFVKNLQPLSSSSSSSINDNKLANSSDSIIIEHRKRPNGDGYTVHKYMRGKMLGKGGFAKVYQVTSLDTNKIYAVKIVPKANLVKNRARQKVSECVDVDTILLVASQFIYLLHMMCVSNKRILIIYLLPLFSTASD